MLQRLDLTHAAEKTDVSPTGSDWATFQQTLYTCVQPLPLFLVLTSLTGQEGFSQVSTECRGQGADPYPNDSGRDHRPVSGVYTTNEMTAQTQHSAHGVRGVSSLPEQRMRTLDVDDCEK